MPISNSQCKLLICDLSFAITKYDTSETDAIFTYVMLISSKS